MAVEHVLELTFPKALVPRPLIYEMARAHDVVFNFAQANVTRDQGHFHLSLVGDASTVAAAESFLRDQGVEVAVREDRSYEGNVPTCEPAGPADPDEPQVSRKLWITFMNELREQPMTWEMFKRFGVTFDVRQSSIGQSVNIMALLIEGPKSRVEDAIAFYREQGAEVEPIEKTVIEG